MHNRIRTFLALMLLTYAFVADAQIQRRSVAEPSDDIKCSSEQISEQWWGYFDGDYNSISVVGFGASQTPPVNYNCAIKVEAGNPDVIGKRIKAIKFAFERTDYIEDVKVWMSTTLPRTPEEADVYCIPLESSSVKSYDKDNEENIVSFPEPYQISNNDLYIGYSFVVTSYEGGLCKSPVVVSYSNTMENAFLVNWGEGWYDNAGMNYGNLALMLLLDDGGEFQPGDANYDLKINVIDVSCTLEYILGGEVKPFNKRGADIDVNGEVNIVDVESMIDMILERYKSPANEKAEITDDNLIAEKTTDGIGVSLVSDNSYRGFQMDIVVPEGSQINSVEAGRNVTTTHNFRCSEICDGRYRLIASSINGTELVGDATELFKICSDTENINIENIIFATSGLSEKRFNDIRMSDVSGLENLIVANSSDCIYNMQGVKENHDINHLNKGVYIVDGKKIIIK